MNIEIKKDLQINNTQKLLVKNKSNCKAVSNGNNQKITNSS